MPRQGSAAHSTVVSSPKYALVLRHLVCACCFPSDPELVSEERMGLAVPKLKHWVQLPATHSTQRVNSSQFPELLQGCVGSVARLH